VARAVETRRSGPLLAGLLLVHLVAISHQVDGGEGTSLLGRALLAVVAPFQLASGAAVRGVSGLWHDYVALRGAREESARLRARVDALETRLQEQARLAREAERLREALALSRILPFESVAAEVIGRDGMPWFRSLTLDKGSRDGVRLNAAVISPTGVLGRVIGVGPSAARVQLLQDRDSGVGVVIERNQVPGVASGQVSFADTGASELVLKYVPLTADVVEGDAVVTSGLDGIYPPGLVVGRVAAVATGSGLFKEVLVAPSADPARVEAVLVLLDERVPPRITESVE
jgi:rod shape-determining protein MreC